MPIALVRIPVSAGKRKRVYRRRGAGFGDFIGGTLRGIGGGIGGGVHDLFGNLFGGRRRRPRVHKKRKRVGAGIISGLLGTFGLGRRRVYKKRATKRKGMGYPVARLALGRRRRGGEDTGVYNEPEVTIAPALPNSFLGKLNKTLKDSQIISTGLHNFGVAPWLAGAAQQLGYGRRKKTYKRRRGAGLLSLLPLAAHSTSHGSFTSALGDVLSQAGGFLSKVGGRKKKKVTRKRGGMATLLGRRHIM